MAFFLHIAQQIRLFMRNSLLAGSTQVCTIPTEGVFLQEIAYLHVLLTAYFMLIALFLANSLFCK